MDDLSIADDFVDPLSNYEPIEYNDGIAQAMAEQSVTTITSTPFASIPPDTSIRDAVHELNRLQVSSLLVIDGQKLVGIFTERDALEHVVERFNRIADHPVCEVMTTRPVVVYESDPIGTALAAIAIGGYRHVPVLSMSGTVLGVVSPRRLIDYLQRQFIEPVVA